MWSLLKFLVFLALLATFVWFGSTVRLGQHTLFGHVSRIWNTEEAQDLVKGVREGSAPAVEKVKRGVKAGVDEATRVERDAGADREGDGADGADEEAAGGPPDAGSKPAKPGKAGKASKPANKKRVDAGT